MAVNSRDIESARRLARILDTAIGIPGTKLRLGLDAIIGLVPGAGDAIGAALSGFIVLAAARAGAPPAVLLRMAGNVALDTLVGSVPVLGDLFDVAFRSNARNAALLERLGSEPVAVERDSRRLGIGIAVVLVLLLVGLVALGFLVARLLWGALTGS